MNRIERTVGLGLALGATALVLAALLAAPAAAAGAVAGFHTAKFRIEIKGTQDVTLRRHSEDKGECGLSDHSSGAEHLVFRTKKPIVITAVDAPGGGFNPEFFGGRRLGVPTAARIERSFKSQVTALPGPECGENGGVDPSAEAFKTDCGVRHVTFPVELQYSLHERDGLLLSSGLDLDAFATCPDLTGVESFPDLLVENGSHGFVYAHLAQKDLFDPGYRKWISIARGSRVVATPSEWHRTKIHWEVSFTRLGGGQGSAGVAR